MPEEASKQEAYSQEQRCLSSHSASVSLPPCLSPSSSTMPLFDSACILFHFTLVPLPTLFILEAVLSETRCFPCCFSLNVMFRSILQVLAHVVALAAACCFEPVIRCFCVSALRLSTPFLAAHSACAPLRTNFARVLVSAPDFWSACVLRSSSLTLPPVFAQFVAR